MQLAEVSFDVVLPPDLLRLEALMLGEIKQAADETAEAMGDALRLRITTPDEHGRVVDSSHELLESIEEDAAEHGDEIEAFARSTSAHAQWVEEGRPAGPVPVMAIVEWMLEKGISPRGGETLLQAAHAIARKITREGFEGRHIFAETQEEADSIAIEALDRAVERIRRRLSQ